MNATSIEWTDLSVNPIRARRLDGKQRVPGHFCQKISPGCANCYASRTQPRFGLPQFPGTNKSPADMGVELFLDQKVLESVLKRRKPAKLFWFDMTDAFGDWVPFEWLDQCFAVMALTPHLTHQVLTKRPERMADYLDLRGGHEFGSYGADGVRRTFGGLYPIVCAMSRISTSIAGLHRNYVSGRSPTSGSAPAWRTRSRPTSASRTC
jgi:hypothetical protein